MPCFCSDIPDLDRAEANLRRESPARLRRLDQKRDLAAARREAKAVDRMIPQRVALAREDFLLRAVAQAYRLKRKSFVDTVVLDEGNPTLDVGATQRVDRRQTDARFAQ